MIKASLIISFYNNVEYLKFQLAVKENQIQDIRKLFENTQVLFRQEQEKNKVILTLPETIKERDIEMVNSLM